MYYQATVYNEASGYVHSTFKVAAESEDVARELARDHFTKNKPASDTSAYRFSAALIEDVSEAQVYQDFESPVESGE